MIVAGEALQPARQSGTLARGRQGLGLALQLRQFAAACEERSALKPWAVPGWSEWYRVETLDIKHLRPGRAPF